MRNIDRRLLLGGALAAAAVPSVTSTASAAEAPLVVGGLAVTCSLTLPVACAARAAAKLENSTKRKKSDTIPPKCADCLVKSSTRGGDADGGCRMTGLSYT